MAFLSSTATIDAILTQQGRLLLSQGKFNPTKFSFGDGEIDYGLLAFPDGENMILNTNILEASSLGGNLDTELQYKLITDASGLGNIATLNVIPSSIQPMIYDILIISVTTNYGTDTSYTVKNNSSLVTLNPYWAITALQKQTYIQVSGKDYKSILSSLQKYAPLYGNAFTGTFTEYTPPSGNVEVQFNRAQILPEVTRTIQVPGSSTQSFFVFIADQSSGPSTINISVQGNNTGAVGNLSIAVL